MNDKKYEADEQIGLLEKQLQGVKKEYRSHQMTKAQEEQIYQKIREAKQMDTGIKNNQHSLNFCRWQLPRSLEFLSYCRIHLPRLHMRWNRYPSLAVW